MKPFALAACAVLASAAPAAAQGGVAVPSLFNTGVTVSGGLLPEGAPDSHYTLVAQPTGSTFGPTPSVAVTGQTPLGAGAWLANGPSSQWLVPGPGASGAVIEGY